MDKLLKAQKNLEDKDIIAKILNNTLYVNIDGVLLQLAEFEINFQTKQYDEKE